MTKPGNQLYIKFKNDKWKKATQKQIKENLCNDAAPVDSVDKDNLPMYSYGCTEGETSNTRSFPTNQVICETDCPKQEKEQIKKGDTVTEQRVIARTKTIYKQITQDESLNYFRAYITSSLKGIRYELKTDQPIINEEQYKKVVSGFLKRLEPFGIDETYHDIRVHQGWYLPLFANYYHEKKAVYTIPQNNVIEKN